MRCLHPWQGDTDQVGRKRGPKCKLGYYRVFNLILWVLYTVAQGYFCDIYMQVSLFASPCHSVRKPLHVPSLAGKSDGSEDVSDPDLAGRDERRNLGSAP